MPRTSYHRLTLALLLLSCLFTLQAAPPVSSQSQTNRLYMPFVGTPPPLSQLTTFGGSLIYHTTANGYAYVAQEQGLSIYRVADLASPQLVGKLRLKGELRSIVVAGTRLYATNDYFSLLVIDVQNPAAPSLIADLSGYDTYDYPQQLVWANGLLAMVGQTSLRLFDMTNPSSPVEKGMLEWESMRHWESSYHNGHLYIATQRLVQVIDIRNPSMPKQVAEITANAYSPTATTHNNVLYLTDGPTLRVFNVSNPAAPQQIGSFSTPNEYQSHAIIGFGRLLLSTDDFALRVLNIDNPAAPKEIGRYDTAENTGGNLSLLPDLNGVLVAEGAIGRIRLVSLANQTKPAAVGLIETPIGNTQSVAISGNYVYATEGDNQIAIIDISQPNEPRTVSRINSASKCAMAVTVAGQRLFVAGYGGMQIFDISNPTNPISLGKIGQQYVDVVVEGNYAYLANLGGLTIFDVSNPAKPKQVSFTSIGGQGAALTVANGRVYFGSSPTQQQALTVIDVSNPAKPTILGTHGRMNGARLFSITDIVVQGSYAYTAADTEGLLIFDVSNPAAISIVGQYDVNGIAQSVAVENNRAFLTDLVSLPLRVINVSTPSKPTLVTSWNASWSPNSVAAQNGKVYLATFGKGIQVFDYRP